MEALFQTIADTDIGVVLLFIIVVIAFLIEFIEEK